MELRNAVEEHVSVGGGVVRVVTAGSGSPAVLFDSALGTPLEAWSLIAPAIAERTRVVLWDRPGVGDSSDFVALGAVGMAEAMASLVDRVGSGPVVAVGHSRGGIHVLALAARRPDAVAGVVLAESSHPDQLSRLPAAGGPLLRAVRLLARAPRPSVHLPARVVSRIIRTAVPRSRPGLRLAGELAPAIVRRLDGLLAELDAGPALLAGTGRLLADRGFPDVPLVVLTGDRNFSDPSDQAVWAEMHGELAALNGQGSHVHVDCGHQMPFSHPDVVIRSICDVLDRATRRS